MSIREAMQGFKQASAGVLTRPAILLLFVGAVVGPFTLLTIGGSESNHLPWYFWAIVSLLLLGVISVGFFRFTRESHEAEGTSISPDRQ